MSTEKKEAKETHAFLEIFVGILALSALTAIFVPESFYETIVPSPSTLLQNGTLWGKLAFSGLFTLGFMIEIAIYRFIGAIIIFLLKIPF